MRRLGKIKTISGIKGSSAVLLAMIFTAFAICIAGSIAISRQLVVKSECETFGRLWTKAILSEYDTALLEDYGIMAYFGDEAEVRGTIDDYIAYSAAGKLDADFSGTVSELAGYELGEPENFREALKKSFAGSAAESVISGKSRHKRKTVQADPDGEEPSAGRKIGNTVVIDTLPSGGMHSSVDTGYITEHAESIGSSEGIRSAIASSGIESLFIWQYFGNHVTTPDDKDSFFTNEWEYIIRGSLDDDENLDSCRKRLFIVRNALDLASLYKDPEKVELLTTAAELITPGPLGAATQLLLAEAWAALEAEADIQALYDNERVPVIKSAGQWKTGLGSVLDSDSVRKKLDDEAKQLLDENREDIESMDREDHSGNIFTDGLNYDEHLMLMILALKKDVRLLRIIDLVQINMRIRHYRDFNLMEYMTGVRYTIKANGRDYYFEGRYR